jgi:hypothetical protein
LRRLAEAQVLAQALVRAAHRAQRAQATGQQRRDKDKTLESRATSRPAHPPAEM